MKTTKNTKTTTKKAVKSTKPAFVVDATWCETIEDLLVAFAEAKYDAGIDLNKKEVDALVDKVLDDYTDELFQCHNCVVLDGDNVLRLDAIKIEPDEKTPWYKRFWNWITRK